MTNAMEATARVVMRMKSIIRLPLITRAPLTQSTLDYEQLSTFLRLRLRVYGGHYLL
jgi:hypothetical protein